MKTRFLRVGRLVTVLVLAAFLPGCLDASEQPAANDGAKTVGKPVTKNTENDSPPIVTAPPPENAPGSEAAPKPELALPKLSPGLAEVIRLAQAQVGESVLLAYIDKSTFEFNPSLEEILYLHDVGISEPVLTALLRRSKQQADATAKLAEAQAAMTRNMAVRKAEMPVLSPAPSIVPSQPAPVAEPVAAPAAEQVAVQPVAYAQPAVISQPVFYNELAPYGTWVDVGSYGRCWQPTAAVIDLNWRPYYNSGRWLDSDCGWYWQSDYSWGAVPFHYGRWYQDRSCGWLWSPGDTWAPAWVSWRSSNAYCGWAPLPPTAQYGAGMGFSYYNSRVGVNFEFGLGPSDYAFLPINRFCDSTPYSYYVPPAQVNTIYKQTTVVNNYVTGNNNLIINHGVDHGAVTAAARSEIRKVAIRDLPTGSARHLQPDRLVKTGDSLTIFRPQVASLTAPASTTIRAERGQAQPTAAQLNLNRNGSAALKRGEATKSGMISPVNSPSQNGVAAHPGTLRTPAIESRPIVNRFVTSPVTAPAAPLTANLPTAPQTPLVPLVSIPPKTLTVPQMKRLDGRQDARGSIFNRLELERPKLSQPQISVAAAPSSPGIFQAPRLSGPTTTPQPTPPSVYAPTTIAASARAISPPSYPRANASELFSRPEVQRPAPPTRSAFQAPAYSAPTFQQPSPAPRTIAPPPVFSAPAPVFSQPSRPQFNPPPPVSHPQPVFAQPARPMVSAPPPSSRPPPAPPSPGIGGDQGNRTNRRNP